MRILESFDPGVDVCMLILLVIGQVTIVVAAAAAIAHTVSRKRAAERYQVWVCALVFTLLGPLIVAAIERAGLTVRVVGWTRTVAAEPVADSEDVNASVQDGSTDPNSMLDLAEASGRQVLPSAEDTHALVAPVNPAVSIPEAATGLESTRAGFEPVNVLARASESEQREAAGSHGATVDVGGHSPFVGFLVLVWAAGVLMGLGLLVAGWVRLIRLGRSLTPFDVNEHARVLKDVSDAIGGRSVPPIAISDRVSGPVTIGLWKPAIVLPKGLASTLAPEELRNVLIHECAHVIRRDGWVALLQRFVGVCYWFHPLVHYMNARLARAREEVCDNFVIMSGDPCVYARTLLELTERYRSSGRECAGLGLMDERWTLRERITGLLDPARDTLIRPKWRATAIAVLTSGALCLGMATIRPVGLTIAQAEPVAEAVGPGTGLDRTVSGIVVDTDGKPVAGATVRLVRREKAAGSVLTGSDGRFTLRLRGMMRRSEELVASAQNDSLMGLGMHTEPKSRVAAKPVRIVLEPGRTVRVHVRDAAGKPVAGAKVEAYGFDYHQASTTGLDGDATLRVPTHAQTNWILGRADGVGFDYFENDQHKGPDKLGPLPAEVTLTLRGARTVRIKAVDSAGQPVPGVTFRPWTIQTRQELKPANLSGSEIATAETDERGIATFHWLPADTDAGWSFVIWPGMYSCPNAPKCEPGNGAVDLEAHLLRGTAISGVVREPDGRPAGGVLIHAEGRGATNFYCRMFTRSAPDGAYRIDVYPDQSYIVGVEDDQGAASSLTGIVVREGQPRQGLDFHLRKGFLLHGRATQEPDGRPAAGMSVTVEEIGASLGNEFFSRSNRPTESLVRWATTDEDGRYQIRLGPGRYHVITPDHRESDGLTVEGEGEEVRDFRIAESAEHRLIHGVVMEAAPAGERVLKGAIVEAVAPGRGGRSIRAATDSEGRFQLSFHKNIVAALYVRGNDGALAGLTRVEPDADQVKVLVAPASRIRGRVVDDRGVPQAERRVQIRLESGSTSERSGQFFADRTTDSSGRYEFLGIAVGTRAEVFVAHNPNPQQGGPVEVENIDVRTPEPIEVSDLVLPAKEVNAEVPDDRLAVQAACEVTGIVVDEKGRRIAGAVVELRKPGEQSVQYDTKSRADGRFRFRDVKPGRWQVLILPEQNAPAFGLVLAVANLPVQNQYVVGPPSYISGKVVDADGKPVAGASIGWIRPYDPNGNELEALEFGRPVQTAADGTFRVGPVPQGEFSLASVITNRAGKADARANQTNVVIRLEAAAPPVKKAAGRVTDTEPLVRDLAARASNWVKPTATLESLEYDFIMGSKVTRVRVKRGERRPASVWMGATFRAGFHEMLESPEKFDITIEQKPLAKIVTLVAKRKDPQGLMRVEIGNGVEQSWYGYYAHPARETSITLDAERLVPLEEQTGETLVRYSGWLPVNGGKWVPQRVDIQGPSAHYRMNFAWLGEAVWLLTTSESITPEQTMRMTATRNVVVDGRAISVPLDEAVKLTNEGAQLIRSMLDHNRPWLDSGPRGVGWRPSFKTLSYTFHTEREGVRERAVVEAGGEVLIELASDQLHKSNQLGERRTAWNSGEYAISRRGERFAWIHPRGENDRERGQPYDLTLKRYARMGCRFDLPLFDYRELVDSVSITVKDGTWAGRPCKVATVAPPAGVASFGCGTMFGFTSWSFVHDIRPITEVIMIDAERAVPVHETITSTRDGKIYEIDFADYVEVERGQWAPRSVRVASKDSITCEYRFQIVAGTHWMLKEVVSWFKPEEMSRGVIEDIRLDGGRGPLDEARTQVASARSLYGGAGEPKALMNVASVPFVVGEPMHLGPYDVQVTVPDKLSVVITATTTNADVPATLPVCMLDKKQRLLFAPSIRMTEQAGMRRGSVTMRGSVAWQAARSVVVPVNRTAAQAVPLRVIPVRWGEPSAVNIPDAQEGDVPRAGKKTPRAALTRAYSAQLDRSPDGTAKLMLDAVSIDGIHEFHLDVAAAILSKTGEVLASGSLATALRVVAQPVQSRYEIPLGQIRQGAEPAFVVIGVTPGQVTSAPMGSRWGQLGIDGASFESAALLAAPDEKTRRTGLETLARTDVSRALRRMSSNDFHDSRYQGDGPYSLRTILRPMAGSLTRIAREPGPAELRADAARLLAHAEAKGAVETLRGLVNDPDPDVLDAAAIGLTYLGQTDGLDRVRSILGRAALASKPAFRWQSVRIEDEPLLALAHQKSDLTLDLLGQTLVNDVKGLRVIDAGTPKAHLEGRTDRATVICGLLGMAGRPRVVRWLIAADDVLAERPDVATPFPRSQIAEAMCAYPGLIKDRIIREFETGHSMTLWAHAMRNSRDPSFLPAVRKMLVRDDLEIGAMSCAIDYLANLESAEATEVMREAYDRGRFSSEPTTWMSLCAKLAAKGDGRGLRDAFEVLISIERDTDRPGDEKKLREWMFERDQRKSEADCVFERASRASLSQFLMTKAQVNSSVEQLVVIRLLWRLPDLPKPIEPSVNAWATSRDSQVAELARRLLNRD